jgi:hypothetical protein
MSKYLQEYTQHRINSLESNSNACNIKYIDQNLQEIGKSTNHWHVAAANPLLLNPHYLRTPTHLIRN